MHNLTPELRPVPFTGAWIYSSMGVLAHDGIKQHQNRALAPQMRYTTGQHRVQWGPIMTILIAGLINYETTIAVEGFPLEYAPVRYNFFGVNGSTSGVGLNLAAAISKLGTPVRLLSLIGSDEAGLNARAALARHGVASEYLLEQLSETPRSAILYEPSGRRAIFTDLKNIQDQHYPLEVFRQAAQGCRIAALCNINFARPLLSAAKQLGMTVASDVHAISDLDDSYNADYMAAADILFMSHERLPCSAGEWIQRVWSRYNTPIAVVGMGAEGALLGMREGWQIIHVPAVQPRAVVSTVGAGDALFSGFLHEIGRGLDPHTALRRAVVFAGYKIGSRGGAEGFLSLPELDQLVR